MDADVLRVIADDLTGACDIAAALLPWPGGVLVEAYPTRDAPPAHALRVRNTQSRMLPEAAARNAVERAVGTALREAVILKKIDTALRGHLGAELDAAVGAAGAAEAFVLPAIPRVGRTTVGGVQRIDGVAVHETTFAHDPLHPIRDSSVAAHLTRGCGRGVAWLSLADVRSEHLGPVIDRGRDAGCSLFVCDAESDDDLERAVGALLARPRPLVVAGSLGLGVALRRRLGVPAGEPRRGTRGGGGTGRLVIVGSTHPMARQQARVVAGDGAMHEVDATTHADEIAARAQAALRRGATVVLTTPAVVAAGAARGLLEAMARAAAACLHRHVPAVLALVGGETAFGVLEAAQQPWIRIDDTPAPLVVAGTLLGGVLDGVSLVTKGGSSGAPDTLRKALGA